MNSYLRVQLILLVLIFSIPTSNAQTAKIQDSILQKMTDKVCQEFQKQPNKKWTAEEAQNTLALSMMPIMIEYKDELERYFDVNYSVPESFEKLGYQLGIKLATDCEVFRNALYGFSVGNDGVAAATPEVPVNVNPDKPLVSPELAHKEETVFGKVVKLNTTEIGSFEVYTEDGKTITVWYFDSFEGVNKLTNPDYNGKQLRITFYTKEVYDVKSNMPRKIFVAQSIF
jgi:hypothetical protein